MSRDDSRYQKSLSRQAFLRLNKMIAFNESKKEAIADGTAQNKIFSFSTYQTYRKQIDYFIKHVEKNHPECTNLKQARPYIKEWLDKNVAEGKSAWTIQTQAKALGKLYGINPGSKDYYTPPVRHRVDITRSRGEAVRDRNFSKKNNEELIRFCKGVGARREGMTKMKGKDLMTRAAIDKYVSDTERLAQTRPLTVTEQKNLKICKDAQMFSGVTHYVYLKEKGGRERISPIIGPDKDMIVERFLNTAQDEKVWPHVNSNADIQYYRNEYAKKIYRMYCRDTDELRRTHATFIADGREASALYFCRKDERGKALDKQAMALTAKALGLKRINDVANNYLMGL